MKLEFALQIYGKKFSNTKFYENPSTGSGVVPYAQTNRHEEADSRFFCNFASAPKNEYESESKIFRTGVAICTAVVVVRSTGRW
jgi:hypothetical protein